MTPSTLQPDVAPPVPATPADEPSLRELRPGDIGFSTIPGYVGGWVNFAQALVRDACAFTHAYGVVHPLGHHDYPDGLVVEAMPRGARFAPLRPRTGVGFAYARMDLSEDQRAMVPAIAAGFTAARGGRGVPYSFLDYLWLALKHWGIPAPHLRELIKSKGHMICSQLVDELHRRIGSRIFTDGRWPQDVIPGALYYATDPRVIKPPPE